MADVRIMHKTQGWLALITWSVPRAESWLSEFDPKMYVDKTLRMEDFEIIVDGVKLQKEEAA